MGGLKPIAIAALGASNFAQMKETIVTKVMEKFPAIVDQSFEYTTEAMDLESTICQKMKGLSPEEFERFLHPAFEEDEITLILVAGILGLLIGIFQSFVVF